MPTVAAQEEQDAYFDSDGLERRRLIILGLVYLVIGLAHASLFTSGTFDDLQLRAEAADTALLDARLQNQGLDVSLAEVNEDVSRLRYEADEMERRLIVARATLTSALADNDEAPGERSTVVHHESRARDAQRALTAAQTRAREIAGRTQQLQDAESASDVANRNVRRGWGRVAGFGLGLLVIGWFVLVQSRRVRTRAQLVSAATAMTVTLGGLLLATRLLLQPAVPGLSTFGIVDILTLHLIACMILPWTPRESLMPFGLLLLIWAATFLVPQGTDMNILDRVVGVIISPIVLVPGAAFAGWRWKRSNEDAERLRLGAQVREMGGELSRARVVHDAMFPDPLDTGHVNFMYEYRPSQEIGGDYVHLHVCRGSGRFYLTLLDVAGHGLTAALTVNRLFGELERIRAEDPDAEPALVMQLLNRYINLTMAPHSLYATGTCTMLDPANGMIKWVNAGHPPALIRKADGRVLDVPGTTMLLGALTWDEFEPCQQEMKISPGDVLLAYTDGAFEARNAEGRQFGLDNIRKTAEFSPPPRDWTKFIANAVSTYHGGHAEDDVLIAALHLRSLCIQVPDRKEQHKGREAERVA